MADTGWLDFVTVKAGTGTPVWQNPSNAQSEDGNVTTCEGLYEDIGGWLVAENIDGSIQAGSTIDGIEVRFKRGSNSAFISLGSLRLHLNETPSGDDKDDAVVWPTTRTFSSTYGGSTDMWSSGYDYDDVMSADFGVMLRAYGIFGSGIGQIDVVQIKIYYTPPAVTVEQEGFRWRNDDGTEITATWIEAQDTDAEIAKETNTRIRFLIDAEGNPAGSTFELQYKRSADGAAEWRKVQVET